MAAFHHFPARHTRLRRSEPEAAQSPSAYCGKLEGIKERPSSRSWMRVMKMRRKRMMALARMTTTRGCLTENLNR